MCGICGELSFGAQPVASEAIRAMATAIAHRGPDDVGYHVDGRVGLGHLRLSIIDTSSRGHQPMWSADGGMCIVFNGEVYNYAELGRELQAQGCRFASSSDTEVVVNAVRLWGVEKAVVRFIGMFAFAVWEPATGELTLVRDRVGIKPLFCSIDANRLLFGSEMRALIAHPGFTKEIDRRGIGQFFVTGATLGETTAFLGTRRVLPGHIVTVSRDGRITDTEYWNLADISSDRGQISLDDAADELQELLESSVRYRLVSDVPVANFLSGGTDSALVASIIQRSLGEDVLNITIGFEEAAFNEAPKAALVARELGLRHLVHYVSVHEIQNGIQSFSDVYDEPFGDTSGIPTIVLSRIARDHVKVALSADGGDEQFGGYDSYGRYAKAWDTLRRIPAPLRQAAAAAGNALPWRAIATMVSGRARDSLRPQLTARIEKALRIGAVRSRGDLVRMMFEKGWSWEGARSLVGGIAEPLFDRTVLSDPELAASDGEVIDTMMRADYRAFLRDDILTKIDRASMHVGLETRDPLLDHRIAEFAFSLPLSLLCEGGVHKRVLKHLLRRTVSENVVSSPKRGFSIPLYAWMRGVWKPVVLDRLSFGAVSRVGILDARYVEAEVRSFYERPGGSAERIWMLLNFQMWAERWL